MLVTGYLSREDEMGAELVRTINKQTAMLCTWLAMLCTVNGLEPWRSKSRPRGAVLRQEECAVDGDMGKKEGGASQERANGQYGDFGAKPFNEK